MKIIYLAENQFGQNDFITIISIFAESLTQKPKIYYQSQEAVSKGYFLATKTRNHKIILN